MAKTQDIKRRIRSVQNTRQLTKAMKMVSAAKLRRSQERIIKARPYAHKLYALETLLVTDQAEERAKVAFTARYKERLQEAFKTMYTQTRETHIKQLEIGMLGSAAPGPPPVPHFRLEPLAYQAR